MALFFPKHPTYPWLEPQLWLQFPSRGGGRRRPELTRPALGCSDTSHDCTLSLGLLLLLLQPTIMSLYCEADKLSHGKLFATPHSVAKNRPSALREPEAEGEVTTWNGGDILGCPQQRYIFKSKDRVGFLALSYNPSRLQTQRGWSL